MSYDWKTLFLRLGEAVGYVAAAVLMVVGAWVFISMVGTWI